MSTNESLVGLRCFCSYSLVQHVSLQIDHHWLTRSSVLTTIIFFLKEIGTVFTQLGLLQIQTV